MSKKPLVHYDASRVVTIAGRTGDTWRVRYLDGTEADVKSDRVGPAMNSHVLMEPGDLSAHRDGPGWQVWARYKSDVERLGRMADDSATLISGSAMSRPYLRLRTFDDLEAWGRRHGVAPAGWTVDLFGGWVPAGDRRARLPGPLRACTDRWGCDRPARDGETLCGQHKAAAARSAKAAAEREERSRQWRENMSKDRAANASSAEWAARLADEFKLRVTPTTDGSGEVEINPEGLYAVLRSIAAEAPWIIEELPAELQLRDLSDPEGRVGS